MDGAKEAVATAVVAASSLSHLILDGTEKEDGSNEVSLVLENILDAEELSPVLGSPKFGLSRATVESAWKQKDNSSSAQEKDVSKGDLKEEQSQGSAEATERDIWAPGRERSKSCPSEAEAEAAGTDADILQAERAAPHPVNFDLPDRSCPENSKAEDKQMEPWKMHTGDSLEEMSILEQTNLKQTKIPLGQEKMVQIQSLQKELWQKEEEEKQRIQMLCQQKEDALQLLKTELDKARQEEELRLRKASEEELWKLQTQIHSETEAEKERIRLSQEAALHKFREELESFQQTQEGQLKKQKLLFLEKMKNEAEAVQQAEQMILEQESKRDLSELKERLCQKKEEAMRELEVQHAAEMQQQQSVAEEEHQKVVLALQIQIAEAQRRKEAELQKELEDAEQTVQQKRQQILEYEQELSDLLKEKRQAVEREHMRQLERMQEAHQAALAGLQAQQEEEERKQRAEQERLRLLHQAELEALQKQQLERLKDLHKSCQEQEEAWRKRRQQFLEEEKQLEHERNEAAVAAHICLEVSQKEKEDLAATTRQLHGALGELQARKTELESQVEGLELQSQRLQQRVSALEEAIEKKQQLLRELEEGRAEASSGEKEDVLRVEDLQESGPAGRENRQPSSREMAPESPKSNEESSLLLDQMRHYISAEGASLKTAKEFLVRQTQSMRKRQSALSTAKQCWRHDLQRTHGAAQDLGCTQMLEGVRQNLEEEGRQLDEMRSAMRRGQALLKKKEEKLSQLESSLLEEISDEDTLKGVACKKVVTFDLSDSEDASSMMSTDGFPCKMDLKPDLQFPPLDKIHYLTDSLRRITRDLNSVLGLLSNFSNQQPLFFTSSQSPVSSGPRDGIPLAAYTSLARVHSATPLLPPAGPQWAWGTGSGQSAAAVAHHSVDCLLTEKWHKYFPGNKSIGSSSHIYRDLRLKGQTSRA
ncbi:centrosomal protein of 164 kDa isoform X2 [Varanus komodoensis]|uniref:centrosomal protein of 164 kDa isoform X2 n=1 Tax=Varanus komodoensis TaxID=61221 RepID=UPI001CF7B682|nr:centrosomal protein of 164 kDa isoform X2 [Varanus komodoensis]